MNCRSCNNEIKQFFTLGDMPLVNSFLKKEDIQNEKKYDLSVGFCEKCYLVQLMETISPEELFVDYIYFSSTSASFLKHSKKTAGELKKRFNLNKDNLVLEIASNDGAQLQYFKELGIRILGVDPAKNIAKVANEKGITTLPEFFNEDFAKKLAEKEENRADLIFGANVLAHVPEIVDFVKGVKVILKAKGTAVFEFPYLRGLLENKFDIIYHEHVFYYGLLTLQNLFKRADLELYDIEITAVQGGSLRIFASHPGVYERTQKIKDLEKKEIDMGYEKLETYQKMNQNVQKLKQDIIAFLEKAKQENKTICAYSAPAKGNILLNFFGINSNYINFLVDKSEAKQGYYTPGTHLLVESPDKIMQEKPDYVLILCWNIADEVMNQLDAYKKQGGTFIIPVPKLKIA